MGRVFGIILLLIILSGIIAWAFTRSELNTQAPGTITPTQEVPTDTHSPSPTPAGKSSTNITVRTPGDNEEVGIRFQVTGEARVFENVVSYRVKNQKNDETYVTGNTMADSPDIGQFGPFTITVILPGRLTTLENGDILILEVFQASPRDGSDADKVTIPLRYNSEE